MLHVGEGDLEVRVPITYYRKRTPRAMVTPRRWQESLTPENGITRNEMGLYQFDLRIKMKELVFSFMLMTLLIFPHRYDKGVY